MPQRIPIDSDNFSASFLSSAASSSSSSGEGGGGVMSSSSSSSSASVLSSTCGLYESLRGKTILVVRVSGCPRLHTYERLSSSGRFAPPSPNADLKRSPTTNNTEKTTTKTNQTNHSLQ